MGGVEAEQGSASTQRPAQPEKSLLRFQERGQLR